MLIATVIILVLTLLNALLVMSEMAIVAVRKSRLRELSDGGNKLATAALELAESPDRFIPTVQIGITLIGILTGAVGQAMLNDEIEAFLVQFEWLPDNVGVLSLGVVVVGVTITSLVIGELVPKRLALNFSEAISLIMAPALKILSRVCAPFVVMLNFFSDLILSAFRIRGIQDLPVTEEEIKIMLQHGEKAGVFEESEKQMIERVFRLDDRRVSLIMTHRKDIMWVELNDFNQDTWRAMAESGHSYFPVCKESTEHVLGVVSVKDLWVAIAQKGEVDLQTILQKPLYVPSTVSVLKVLDRLRETRTNIALVVDEYGSLEGLVTITDIVAAVVGGLPSDSAADEQAVIERDDGSLLVDGGLAFDEFEDLMNLTIVDDDKDAGEYQTLAGFILHHLGRFPGIGEKFQWRNLVFEVVDMDGYKIDRILVTSIPKEVEES